MVGRALGGFVVGFCAATALFFGFIYAELSPLEQDVRNALPYVQDAYNVTHSYLYQEIESLLPKIVNVANVAKVIPGIGTTAMEVSEGASALSQLLSTSRSLTEKILPVLESVLMLIQVSVPAIFLSLIGVLGGLYMLSKDKRRRHASN